MNRKKVEKIIEQSRANTVDGVSVFEIPIPVREYLSALGKKSWEENKQERTLRLQGMAKKAAQIRWVSKKPNRVHKG